MAPARKPARRSTTSKAVKKPPAKPPKKTPPKPTNDAAWLAEVRDALLERRRQITTIVQSGRGELAAGKEAPADIADLASDGFEDELTAGLLTIEAAQLEEVDEALARLDRGEYGDCIDCGKPIPKKRLDILPFAKRCLKCEGAKEQAARMGVPTEEEENDLD
jgi:DnaK suppressor protein